MSFLEECIEALGNQCEVIEGKMYDILFDELQDNFPFAFWGQIDWEKMVNKLEVYDDTQLVEFFNSEMCYIFWNDASVPVLKAPIEKVVEVIDDVTAVSFDTWLLSESKDCVIELYHDGRISIGFME